MRFRLAFLLLFLTIFFKHGKSQPWSADLNLILNPSFEEYDQCPNYSDLGRPRWEDINLRCKYWEVGAIDPRGRPSGRVRYLIMDPFCGKGNLVINGLRDSSDFNRTGLASTHIRWLMRSYPVDLSAEYSSRTYLQGKLAKTLKAGKRYFVSFFVKPFDPNPDPHDSFPMVVPREIGIHFHRAGFKLNEEQYTQTPNARFDFWNYKPQIQSPPNQALTQMNRWYEVKGSFVADGTEEEFLVGNFTLSKHTTYDTIQFMQNSLNVNRMAHFIYDDFTLIPYPDLGNDTCLNTGDSVLLSIENPGIAESKIRWSNGKTGSSIYAKRTGRYSVSFKVGYTSFEDIIRVKPATKEVVSSAFSGKMTLCEDSVLLELKHPTATNLLWNTGDTSSSIVVRKSGNYSLSYKNPQGCKYMAEVEVYFPRPKISVNDTFLCYKKDTSQYVTHHNGNWDFLMWKYEWRNLENGLYRNNGDSLGAREGINIVEAHKDGCVVMDTFEVELDKTGFVDMRDHTVCLHSDMRCRGYGFTNLGRSRKNVEFLWSTGSTDTMLCIPKTDTYWVETKTPNGCVFRDTGFYKLVKYEIPDHIICKDSLLQLNLAKVADSLKGEISNPRWYFEGNKNDLISNLPTVVLDEEASYVANYKVLDGVSEPYMYCNIIDTFRLSFDSIVGVLPNDTVLCNNNSFRLKPKEAYDSLFWSNGTTNKPLQIQWPFGKYVTTLYRNGCSRQDSIIIEGDSLHYSLKLPPSPCPDDTVLFKVNTQKEYHVLWPDSSSVDSFAGLPDTMYSLVVSNDRCKVIDSFRLQSKQSQKPKAPRINKSICLGDTIIVQRDSLADSWFWNGEEKPASTVSISNATEASVLVKSECYEDEGFIDVNDSSCLDTFYVPNSFTPNGDGLNDEWKVSGLGIDKFKCNIYQRNGQRVARLQSPDEGWDGTSLNQEDAPMGAYFYLFTLKIKGVEFSRSGQIILIR